MTTHDCHRRRLAAVCGAYCGVCEAYRDNSCCGCAYALGCTRRGECAVFTCCVADRGLEHCGECIDFPCQVFMSHASPQVVAKRYRALCRRVDVGTTAWLDEQERKA
ncbi:MAG: DUF3795 domain-containing protein [Anaerolineae bacterium]|nr:DUF3795 domain-containing protein [Anaerolineae bacterium]